MKVKGKTIIIIFALTLPAVAAGAPQSPTSKGDAVRRARIVYPTYTTEELKRLELPVASTGTGPHDFFNLFARLPRGKEAVFGIGISTAHKIAPDAAQLSSRVGGMEVDRRQKLNAGLGGRITYVEAVFPRSVAQRAADSGDTITLRDASGPGIRFSVPGWMFAALIEASDANDPVRKARVADEQLKAGRQLVRDAYIASHPDLSERIRDAIAGGKIVLGMTAEDAIASWGKADKVNRTVAEYGTHEQWIYGDIYVYFEDGVLKSWQDSR